MALLLGSVLGLGLRLMLFVVATVVVRAVAVALAAPFWQAGPEAASSAEERHPRLRQQPVQLRLDTTGRFIQARQGVRPEQQVEADRRTLARPRAGATRAVGSHPRVRFHARDP